MYYSVRDYLQAMTHITALQYIQSLKKEAPSKEQWAEMSWMSCKIDGVKV